jgi:uncharacterized membrane protein YfcA
MKFDRRVHFAAQVAFVIWVTLFVGMIVGSKVLHKNPTVRWLQLFGILLLPVAADQIVNSEWHSAQWWSVEHRPAFYVGVGTAALVFGMGATVAGFIVWSDLNWFH